MLLTNSELADDVAISIGVALLEVIEQTSPLAHEHEQTATRTVILFVCFEMLRQFADPLTQDGDLNLGASRIRIVGPELLYDVCLSCRCQHSYTLLLISSSLS